MEKENLEYEKEETEGYLCKLEQVKSKFISTYGDISESELPIDEKIEFRGLILKWLNSKIAIGKEILDELKSSIAWYENG